MEMRGIVYAMFAGLCAALASVSAKLAMASEATSQLCEAVISVITDTDASLCDWVVFYVRIAFFGMIFVFNALMWTLHVKSLQFSSSSVQATVTNTASNIILTALLGQQIFGETLSLMWWAGASLILLGLAFIHHGSAHGSQDKEKVS